MMFWFLWHAPELSLLVKEAQKKKKILQLVVKRAWIIQFRAKMIFSLFQLPNLTTIVLK